MRRRTAQESFKDVPINSEMLEKAKQQNEQFKRRKVSRRKSPVGESDLRGITDMEALESFDLPRTESEVIDGQNSDDDNGTRKIIF